jgi:TolB-like protein/Tfp pilus assembly protein PilF
MDFGLARLPKAEDKTEPGVVMGTPAYISPEQVEGSPADARSDLYALGIILYEMLTGKAPFTASTLLSLAVKHVTSVPKDPREINAAIPESLSRVVLKCLEKDPKKRYQSAEEVFSDLGLLEKDLQTGEISRSGIKPTWRGIAKRVRASRLPQAAVLLAALIVLGYFIYHQFLTPPEAAWKSSIAVLPVEDQSPQKAQEALCRGLQEDIIAKLSSIPELRIVPLLSVSQYDYSGKEIREIGKDLGADYLLKLVLQEEGKRLRVTLDIIDARGNELMQPYTYVKDLYNYFEIQDEISRYIARALEANLVESRLRTIKMREPGNLVAYYDYLEAMRLIEDVYHKFHRPDDFAEAVRRYEKAIELDPNYALAYWGLGNAYEARYNSTTTDKDPGDLEKMRSYYMEAHERNPDLAETNLGLGWMYFNFDNNVSASKHFKRALELDPQNFIVNLDVGAFLRSVGLYEKALKYFQRALQVDPLSGSTRILISTCRMGLGEFEEAAREVEMVIEKEPRNFEARYYYALELVMMNRLNDADKEIETALKIAADDANMISLPRALLWAARGEREKALAFIRQNERLEIAGTYLYILLGMNDEAIRNIEAGIEKGFEVQGEYLYSYPSLAKNPIFKGLRSEPRFWEIVRREKPKYQEKLRKFARM